MTEAPQEELTRTGTFVSTMFVQRGQEGRRARRANALIPARDLVGPLKKHSAHHFCTLMQGSADRAVFSAFAAFDFSHLTELKPIA